MWANLMSNKKNNFYFFRFTVLHYYSNFIELLVEFETNRIKRKFGELT